jgi:hypothetical protein
MKVDVPVIIQDPSLPGAIKSGVERIEEDTFSCFLDGPTTDRVAVVDFHPKSGKVVRGARFEVPSNGKKIGQYSVKDPNKFEAADFCQCTTFGVVAATMEMFEESDVLGRKLNWAFKQPQLLVVPRAGEWANAFYQRETGSIQFFFFKSVNHPDMTVYTCLSRDIVAHETAHAVLDSVCPSLYDAISPQALALHEAIADLSALLVSFRNRKLSEMVLKRTKGSIAKSHYFSAVAEQFGQELNGEGVGYLRNLKNDDVLDATNMSADPHELCNVLTGAIYRVAMKLYAKLKKEEVETSGEGLGSWRLALFKTHERLSRMLFRAIDYLPPGEVSFGDYGRAILAADEATHVDYSPEREWLKSEFVRRGIVESKDDLAVETNYTEDVKDGMDFNLNELRDSAWTAYTFARKNRDLLGIPKDVPFEIHPRLDVTKNYYVGNGNKKAVRELLFKVSWQHAEENPGGWMKASHRRFTVGTTLAIDWDKTVELKAAKSNKMHIRAKLTTTTSDQTRRQRDKFVERLMRGGFVVSKDRAPGLDNKPRRATASAEVTRDHLRIRGTMRALHLVGGKS